MSRWLISYQHTSWDLYPKHLDARTESFGGFAIEVADVHPVSWLLKAKRREREPLAEGLPFDRRTRVEAILSAIEIPDGLFTVADKLEDEL